MTPASHLKLIPQDTTDYKSKREAKGHNYWLAIKPSGYKVRMTYGCYIALGLTDGDKLSMSREGNKITFVKSADGDVTFELHRGRYNIPFGQTFILDCSPMVMRTLRAALIVAFGKNSGKLYCEVKDGVMTVDAGRQRELIQEHIEKKSGAPVQAAEEPKEDLEIER